MSLSQDQFGNNSATDFANVNALGANSGATAGTSTPDLGQITPFNSAAGVPAPASGGMTVSAPAGAAPASGASGTAGAGSQSGFDWGSILGNIGSDIGSILNSPLGSLAEFTALYKQIAGQANNTQKENNALAGQISAIGQPDVTAGKNMLDSYTSGKLTAPFQSQVDASKYADQAAATSQSQQVASALANAGGQNVQSAQLSQNQQITAQRDQADRLAVSNAFLGELSASLNLTQTGGAFVQSGIMQEIQSNTQLQAQLADLMGSLAKAYAEQTANKGGAGGGGSGGGGFGGLINDATKLWSGIKGLFGGGDPAPGNALSSNPTDFTGMGGAGAVAGVGTGAAAAGAAGAAGAGAGAGSALGGAIGVTESLGTSGLPAIGTLGGAGAEAAGAGAAGAGAGAGAAGAGAIGAGEAGAGSAAAGGTAAGGEAGAGAGAGVSALGGVGIMAAAAAVMYGIAKLWPEGQSTIIGYTAAGAPIRVTDYNNPDPEVRAKYLAFAKQAQAANAGKQATSQDTTKPNLV